MEITPVKLEKDLENFPIQQNNKTQKLKADSEENRSCSNSILEQAQSPLDDSCLTSASPLCPAPICRQFWNAGSYSDEIPRKTTLSDGKNCLQIHPMFLHSNATSHKWAFGAIAELIDNAVDEIPNGASFVIVDKTQSPRDGSPALLLRDDGGGMDPDAMKRCMSFGFSDKKSGIGQYGNGFKTSTMRLGADVIVFSRHWENGVFTQSVGLLSYTFLTRTGHDRIVVPMGNYLFEAYQTIRVHSFANINSDCLRADAASPSAANATISELQAHYEFNSSTNCLEPMHQYGKEHFTSNLSVLLQWSPYSTEAALKEQFNDIGYHGTKVIIYNLWLDGGKNMELNFDKDPQDICIGVGTQSSNKVPGVKAAYEQHIASRYEKSLRAYLSILYLRMPGTFRIILRGLDVEHYNLARDLKYPQFIVYRPQSDGNLEGTVLTTIGFLKEAPEVNVHGFNIYHKNRLILPFFKVVTYSDSRGRGVVGVLEANFVQPTHNKQDFERTSLFQKLEVRLKAMTWEYWDIHCGLLGYQCGKKRLNKPVMMKDSYRVSPYSGKLQTVALDYKSPAVGIHTSKGPPGFGNRPLLPTSASPSMLGRSGHPAPNKNECFPEVSIKRKGHDLSPEPDGAKRQAVMGINGTGSSHGFEIQPVDTSARLLNDPEAVKLLQKNRKLHTQCLEYEKKEEELSLKVTRLKIEISEVQRECERLMAESNSLLVVKGEKVM